MRITLSTLLCVVVSLSHGLEPGIAEYRSISYRNESAHTGSTSLFDITTSNLIVASLKTYQGLIETSLDTTTTASPSDASAIVESSGDDDALTDSNSEWTIFNLGTITTIARPTLVLPTSTPVRISPGIDTTQRIETSSSLSSSSNVNTDTSLTSSFNYNTTSKPWGWNNTSTAPLLPTLTVTPPPSTITSATSTTATPSECPVKESGPIIVTSYSITHTATITWSGDPSDYTPPYAPISTPAPCTPRESPTGRFTITFCDGESCSFIHTSTGDFANPTPTSTVTLTTTDKNPAVVFPTEAPPDYGGSPSGPDPHESAVGGEDVAPPDYGMSPTNAESTKESPLPTPIPTQAPAPTPVSQGDLSLGGSPGLSASPEGQGGGGGKSGSGSGSRTGAGAEVGTGTETAPVAVVVQPSEVVIDDHTFTDNPAQPTSTVVLGESTFIIEPSRVIGAGATITRPPSSIGGAFAPMPTPITTSFGSLGIVYGPSVVTIDGTIFTLEPTPTVAVVQGQTITLGSDEIIFPSQTLHVVVGPGPRQTAVMGGELITAIGPDKVVIEGTTITYGSGPGVDATGTITTAIDGDIVLIAPTGVVVHNETLGGVTAAPDATTYEIVGGATITQMGLTAVEISGRTFHIGFGASTALTTVIDGHTLTIGPDGVGMSTWTLGAPYASTTTLMPGGGRGGDNNNNNAAMSIPTETGGAENNGGSAPRPDWLIQELILVGVWGLWSLLLQL
ncbi:hypothetical protein M426DRAFT_19359 [Hypoxylon sp. CI-4A]|nr:hypothetical protein M426DRAFT_19359 [Hypoxylon sp. CI-4A]